MSESAQQQDETTAKSVEKSGPLAKDERRRVDGERGDINIEMVTIHSQLNKQLS